MKRITNFLNLGASFSPRHKGKSKQRNDSGNHNEDSKKKKPPQSQPPPSLTSSFRNLRLPSDEGTWAEESQQASGNWKHILNLTQEEVSLLRLGPAIDEDTHQKPALVIVKSIELKNIDLKDSKAPESVVCFIEFDDSQFKTPNFQIESGWKGEGKLDAVIASESELICEVCTWNGYDVPLESWGIARLEIGALGLGEFSLEIHLTSYHSLNTPRKLKRRKECATLVLTFEVQSPLPDSLKDLEFPMSLDFLARVQGIGEIVKDTKRKISSRPESPSSAIFLRPPALTSDPKLQVRLTPAGLAASRCPATPARLQPAVDMFLRAANGLSDLKSIGPQTHGFLKNVIRKNLSPEGLEHTEDLLRDISQLSFSSRVFQPLHLFYPPPEIPSNERESLYYGKTFSLNFQHSQEPGKSSGINSLLLKAENSLQALRWAGALRTGCQVAKSAVSPTEDVSTVFASCQRTDIADYCKGMNGRVEGFLWVKVKQGDQNSRFQRRWCRLKIEEKMVDLSQDVNLSLESFPVIDSGPGGKSGPRVPMNTPKKPHTSRRSSQMTQRRYPRIDAQQSMSPEGSPIYRSQAGREITSFPMSPIFREPLTPGPVENPFSPTASREPTLSKGNHFSFDANEIVHSLSRQDPDSTLIVHKQVVLVIAEDAESNKHEEYVLSPEVEFTVVDNCPLPSAFAIQVAIGKVSGLPGTAVASHGELGYLAVGIDFHGEKGRTLPLFYSLYSHREETGDAKPGEVAWNQEIVVPMNKEVAQMEPEQKSEQSVSVTLQRVHIAQSPEAEDKNEVIASAEVPLRSLYFGRACELRIPLSSSLGVDQHSGTNQEDLAISGTFTMRSVILAKTVWPAQRWILQSRSGKMLKTPKYLADPDMETMLVPVRCALRSLPKGVEIYATGSTDQQSRSPVPLACIDYFAILDIVVIDDSTLHLTVNAEDDPTSLTMPLPSPHHNSTFQFPPKHSQASLQNPHTCGLEDDGKEAQKTLHRKRSSVTNILNMASNLFSPSEQRRASYASSIADSEQSFNFGDDEVKGKLCLYVIQPCPAAKLAELLEDRIYHFRERSMVRFVLRRQRHNAEMTNDLDASLDLDTVQDGYSEESILTTAVGALRTISAKVKIIFQALEECDQNKHSKKQVKLLARLQRLSMYYLQLVEANLQPKWCLNEHEDLREMCNSLLDEIFAKKSSRITHSVPTLHLENTEKAAGQAIKLYSQKLYEARLALFDQPDELVRVAKVFHQTYYLRTMNELAFYIFKDEVFPCIHFKTLLGLFCFIMNQEYSFYKVLMSHTANSEGEEFGDDLMFPYIFSLECFVDRLKRRLEVEIFYWMTRSHNYESIEDAFHNLNTKSRLDVTGKNRTDIPEDICWHLEESFVFVSHRIGLESAKLFYKGMMSSLVAFSEVYLGVVWSMRNSKPEEQDRCKILLISLVNDISRMLGPDFFTNPNMKVVPAVLLSDEHIQKAFEQIKQEIFQVGLLALGTLIDLMKDEIVIQWEVFFSKAWQNDEGSQVAKAGCTKLISVFRFLKGALDDVPYLDIVIAMLIEYVAHLYMARFYQWSHNLAAMKKKVSVEDVMLMEADLIVFEKAFTRFGEASRSGLQRFQDFVKLLEQPLSSLSPSGLVDILRIHGGPKTNVDKVILHCLMNREDISTPGDELEAMVNNCKKKSLKMSPTQLARLKSDAVEIPHLNAFEWTASMISNDRDKAPPMVHLLNPQTIKGSTL